MSTKKKQISLYINGQLWRKVVVLAYLRSVVPNSSFIEFLLSSAISKIYSRELNQERLQELADRLSVSTDEVEEKIVKYYNQEEFCEADPILETLQDAS